MVILGVDPGYAIVGYGVLATTPGGFVPMEFGAIVTQAGTDFNSRLQVIYDGVEQVIAKYHPQALSIEKLFFNNNQKTAIGVAQARGVILLAAQKAGVKIYEYTPLQVKIAVTGYGRAEKHQIMEMTRKLLKLKEVPRPDDTADALAIAICHGQAMGSALRRGMQDLQPPR